MGVTDAQSYGPVDLEGVDPLSLSWNQIHWLVKDQIKEVEELKAEHDEIYNEIAGCYGLEKCLSEFDLVDIQPGTKLWNLGLRRVDLTGSELTRQRNVHEQMKQRQMDLVRKEEMRLQELHRQQEEIRRQEALEQQKLEAAKALLESSSSSRQSSFSSSNSGSGWSESSSSYSRTSSSSSARGQPFYGQNPWLGVGGSSNSFFSNQTTVYGPKPEVFDRSYQYSSQSRTSNSRSRTYNG